MYTFNGVIYKSSSAECTKMAPQIGIGSFYLGEKSPKTLFSLLRQQKIYYSKMFLGYTNGKKYIYIYFQWFLVLSVQSLEGIYNPSYLD